MPNPAGNYPGRQIFLGRLSNAQYAFAYFGSGRSPASQQRYATPFISEESAIRIKPLNATETFDPFRHYQAVRVNKETGLVVVSNSQAPNDPLYEMYTFSSPEEKRRDLTARVLGVIGPEYDNPSKPTSRVTGILFPTTDQSFGAVLGISAARGTGHQHLFEPRAGEMKWVSTYNGNVEYENFDPQKLVRGETIYVPRATNARDLANEIYDASTYVHEKYGELRVWALAGVHTGNGPGGWDLFTRNRFNP
ncbi:MAG: hypothetical protein HY393_03580 [Candidatus Diapherotrites archaeon]|nr:hypothetical protein [Candidatus Diapherotrites archaeon]